MHLDMRREFDGLQLGDCRRARRVKRIVERLSSRPDESFPKAMASRAETEALYRLVESADVTFEALSKPHRRETASRCAARPSVLVVHDTTDFRYAGDARDGLGKVSTSTDKCQGFYAHFSLAVAGDGNREPLGVLAVERWARREPGVSTRRRAGELTDAAVRKLPRESARWLRGVEHAAAEFTDSEVSPIHIMDSEADDYALYARLTDRSHRFVVRGYHDRRVVDEADVRTIKQLVAKLPIEFEVYTDLSKRKIRMFNDRKRTQKRAPRTAQLAFSAARISLKRPDHVEKDLPTELMLNVVHVREIDAPDGNEPVNWTLLTSEPIDTDDQISRIVDHYRARWVIEEFFKALKTGCAFEKRQLESMHTLENALALFVPIAWGLLRLRSIARDYPDQPATNLLQPIEIMVLQSMKLVKPTGIPTARETLLAVAQLGGFLKANGEPGWLILGRGYQELVTMAAGFRLALQIRDQS
jgi:transposase-like protein/DDE family transposase